MTTVSLLPTRWSASNLRRIPFLAPIGAGRRAVAAGGHWPRPSGRHGLSSEVAVSDARDLFSFHFATQLTKPLPFIVQDGAHVADK